MKKGRHTSEYWLIMLATLIAAAMPMIPAGSPAEKIAAAVLAMLGALGYGHYRTSLKKQADDA